MQILEHYQQADYYKLNMPAAHAWEFLEGEGTQVMDDGQYNTTAELKGNAIWYDAETVLYEEEGCTLCVYANVSKIKSGTQSAYFSQNYDDVVGSCYDCEGTAQGSAEWLECGCNKKAGPCGC